MLTPEVTEVFDRLYRTDLVFEPGCWQLCGDAHCCSFSRHKAGFELFSAAAQELPLIPGEWAYLNERGVAAQFAPSELRAHEYALGDYTIRWNTVASRRPGCACDHDTRTLVCRLYPLLPVYRLDGQLIATEPLGMYEELETLEGLPRACQVDAVPFDQLNLFLDVARSLGNDRVWRFYLLAYRHTKRHVFDRLAASRTASTTAFRQFELAMLRRRLVDHDVLRHDLNGLLAAVAGDDLAGFAELAEELHAADDAYRPG